jgi:hypothetical protein
MPALAAIPFPDANAVMMALLGSLQVNGTPVPIVLALPNDFTPPIIEIKRIGGRPDADAYTDFPIILVNYWGVDYDSAQALASAGHTKIEMSPLTEVTTYTGDKVLIDTAGIWVGEQELPDVYPDERHIATTYQLGLRRQWWNQ